MKTGTPNLKSSAPLQQRPPAADRKQRLRNLKQRYGITPEVMDRMLATQGGGCAICSATEPGGKGWHLDHDHETDKIRGVLCMRCNMTLLGWHRDDPDSLDRRAQDFEHHAALLRRASAYLRAALL